MDQYLKQKTLENLTKAHNVIIYAARQTGFDGLASSLAMYLSLKKIAKNVTIVAPQPTVGDSKRLYGVDHIGQTPDSKNLVIAIDNAVKNVDKVSYFLDNEKLKIIIHVLPNSEGISKEEISFERTSSKPDMIFAIGAQSSQELEREITHEQIINSSTWIVNIGIHELNQKLAQVNIITGESSFSEITAQLLRDLALPVDEDIAYNLYEGIHHTTENFSPAKVSSSTFQVAEWLIRFGAGRASLVAVAKTPTDTAQTIPASEPFFDKLQDQPPSEEVELEKGPQDWLKPPKIFKGSSSFDTEH